MNILLPGIHPTFDALSAFADQPDVDAARTRVGRHVSRCAACAGTVGEIRALGEAARSVELPGAPADLWSRIERAHADTPASPPTRTTPSPDIDPWKAAPALRPTTHVPVPLRRALRATGVVLAAAAIVVAVLLVPTSRGEELQAGSTAGTWRFVPANPAPGAMVEARYLPAPDERLPRTMLLLAGFARPRGVQVDRAHAWTRGLQDSVATLVRQADGTYAGRFVLPRDFSAMIARLADSTGRVRARIRQDGGPVRRTSEVIALLVGGDERGRPTLAALTSALDLWNGTGAYHVSDSLIKYFPSEPIGYAAARPPRSRNLLDGLINWFGSGERQYLKFDRRLMTQPRVSADHAIAMIRFARRIDEPAEVRKWTMRLAAEHPADPRALSHYSAMLSDMLSRHGTVDSVRRGLPLADTLWERNGHQPGTEDLIGVARIVGDTVAHRRWSLRAMESGWLDWRGFPVLPSAALLHDPTMRRAAASYLRLISRDPCTIPSGKYPLGSGWMSWTERCIVARASSLQGLSLGARLDGDLPGALALADSALALMESTMRCWTGGSHVRRGEALLAMGDVRAAAPALAWGAIGVDWRADAYRDSLARILSPAVGQGEWDAAIARASAAQTACNGEIRQRMKVQAERERAAESAGGPGR